MTTSTKVAKSKATATHFIRSVYTGSFVDALFMGFALTFAFKAQGLSGALVFLAAQYLASSIGFQLGFARMRRAGEQGAHELMNLGTLVQCILLMVLGLGLGETTTLAILTAIGIFRGLSGSGRQWLEMTLLRGAERDSYLATVQSRVGLFKLGAPLVSASILWVSRDNFGMLFAAIGACGAIACAWNLSSPKANCPPPTSASPLNALRSKTYWRTAPFYILDSANAALRIALFVSGTVAMVGSGAAYGMVDAAASAMAALMLALLAKFPPRERCTMRLAGSLAVVGAGWLMLLGSMVWPILFVVFIAADALGTPVLKVAKQAILLKGLSSMHGNPADNATAREVLMVGSRLCALGLAAWLSTRGESVQQSLILVVGAMLLLIPFEFLLARRVARGDGDVTVIDAHLPRAAL